MKKQLKTFPALTPLFEQKIMAGFGRATVYTSWWKKKMAAPKFCARCGKNLSWRLSPEESQKRWICVGCSHIAYLNPTVVVGVLPLKGEKIYLMKRGTAPSKGLWTIPGGYVELGETIQAAARREVWEEIKTRVRLTQLHGVYSYADAGVVTVVYRARVIGPKPKPSPEALSVQAFRPSGIPWEKLAFRSTFQALRDWITSLNN